MTIAGLLITCSPVSESNGDQVNVDHVTELLEFVNREGRLPALISFDDLETIQEKGLEVVLLDVRKPEAYAKGHLPSARSVWRSEIESSSFPYQGMALEAAPFESLLREKGVRQDDHLVVYDGVGGCDAARVWWMLQVYGHHRVSLLDGGWMAWEAQGSPTEQGQGTQFRDGDVRFVGDPQTDLAVGYSELVSLMTNETVVVIDTRSTDEFKGTLVKKGAQYGGHIPGSVHYDWGNAVDFENGGRVKNPSDVKAQLTELGIDSDDRIVVYCHSGVRAAHTTFVLKELLGYPHVSNYDGSWIEWSYLTTPPATEGNQL